MNTQKIWQKIQADLKLTLSIPVYKTWFRDLDLKDKQDNNLIIECPNLYTKETLEKERYNKILKDFCETHFKEEVNLSFEIKEKVIKKNEGPLFNKGQKIKEEFKIETEKLLLNKKYLLENYVIGSSNDLAVAAAKAVIENPGKTYNPFFIYGGVGLGKTHMICAIGNEILLKDAKKEVLYVTSEKFTNELIMSIQKNKTPEFREKYRQADVLIIDDIQFFAGKEASQEEFFHTFNALYTDNKQIILTSDKPPREINKLEERLVSRFEGGLTVDIQTPDYETRVAILNQKCDDKNFNLSAEIIEYLAENVTENIRKLEGLLSQIVTYGIFQKKEIEIADVERILGKRETKKVNRLSPDFIINTTTEFYGIRVKDLKGRSRKAEIVKPRQVVMYLLKKQLNMPLIQIGEYLGNRDHSTVIYAIGKLEKAMNKKESGFYDEIMTIKKLILS